ncbi:LysM peptidoglycan-binding domain-containing protein [Methylobacterium sp. JK268]
MTAELRRGVVLAGIGLAGGIALIGVVTSGTRLLTTGRAPETAAPAPSERPPAPAAALSPAPTPPPAEAPRVPRFDVIRVEPSGESVMAGRAAPGSEVELLRNGEVLARATADAAGQFALLPPALPPGSHEIRLRSVAPDGKRTGGPESVVVAVAPDRATKPLVAVTAPGQPTAVLSQPDEPARAASSASPPALASREGPGASAEQPPAAPAATAPIRIASVDAEAGGKLFVSAQGAPQASVRLYLNDTLVAPGRAGPDGRIAFAIGRGVRPGEYRVRIDQVDPATGMVKTRSEVNFAVPPSLDAAAAEARPQPGPPSRPARPAEQARAPAPVPQPHREASAAAPVPAPRPVPATPAVDAAVAPAAPAVAELAQDRGREPGTVFVTAVSTATVARGDNLWSISRKAYGRGVRYTVIFGANQAQIRNPNRIYPGQVFVLPGEATQAAGSEKRG